MMTGFNLLFLIPLCFQISLTKEDVHPKVFFVNLIRMQRGIKESELNPVVNVVFHHCWGNFDIYKGVTHGIHQK